MNNKVKLGIFVLAGLFAVLASIVAVGNFSLARTYTVYVYFDNASGLVKKAKVKIAGVDIGVLKDVELAGSKARLRLAINENVALYQDAKAAIVSMGIIGTRYIDINPGDPSLPRVRDGDTIASTDEGSLEQTLTRIADKISSALDDINGGKNGNMFGNLADAVRDLKSILHNIAGQNEKITSSINNINNFSYNLAQITAQNKQDIRDAISNMRDIAEKVDKMVAKIYQGDGPLGALINDEDMSQELRETVTNAKEALASAKVTLDGLKDTIGRANKLQFSWNYLGRYNMRDEKFRNDLGIKIAPSEEKFYYVGISNVADSKDAKTQDEKDSMNTLDALLGFRFDKFEVYGGIMRGTAGGGIGYSFFEPIYAPYRKLQAFVNVYNISRTGATSKPEVDLGVRFGFTKWLYAGVMVEDTLYRSALTPYIKIEINDRDLAALLGIISIAAVSTK
ncbi:MAG: MlaD family protein [Endomicrobia bacterium]|nr:MlaD family protein [Endomicrobiia bacterium]